MEIKNDNEKKRTLGLVLRGSEKDLENFILQLQQNYPELYLVFAKVSSQKIKIMEVAW
jgi:hypothetical protein